MKTRLLARLAVLTALLHTAPQALGFDAGADNFANATVITPDGTQTSGVTNLTSFTSQAGIGEPGHRVSGSQGGGHSAWWAYTAPESGYLTVDTVSGGGVSNSVKDTVLAVYTGNAINALTVLARNDDYSNVYTPDLGTLSRLTFYAQAGTTYRIAVDGWSSDHINGTEYNVRLTLRLMPLRKLTRNAYINIDNLVSLSGGLTYTTTGTGAFSGKLTLGGKAIPLAGVFGVDGLATVSIVRPVAKGAQPLPPLTLVLDGSVGGSLYLYPPETGDEYSFTVLEQSVFKVPADNPVPGYYTGGFNLGGNERGYVTATVKSNGTISGSFTLPDGVAVPFTSVLNTITPGSLYRAYIHKSLSAGKGMLTSYLTFTNDGAADKLTFLVDYVRPAAKPGVVFYAAGISASGSGSGGIYVKLSQNVNLLALQLTDEGGELGGNIEELCSFTLPGKFTFQSLTRKPTLSLNPATGVVTGSITAPPLKKRTIKAVFFQKSGDGAIEGFVTGTAKNLRMIIAG